MQLNPNADHRWSDVVKRTPRSHLCHQALAEAPLETTNERISHYAHQPSPLLARVGEELQHSLPDVVKSREQLSMRWVEAYARSVTQENVVPGSMVFSKQDESLPSVLDILNQYCGATK